MDIVVGNLATHVQEGLRLRVIIFTFYVQHLLRHDPSINKGFLGQKRLENGLPIMQINAVQILSFDFVLGQHLDAVEHAELGDVEEDLQLVGFAGLNRVEAHVQLGQQFEQTHVLQLTDFRDFVLRQVQEAQGVHVFEAAQERDLVLRQVQGAQRWKLLQAGDLGQLIVRQI